MHKKQTRFSKDKISETCGNFASLRGMFMQIG